ncbi:MAG TPA: PDZ domain-containing protein, partial [Longimicrobiales bacterium]|nr:PDZ domain-containing protein [Longimicrobiales bacterium]
ELTAVEEGGPAWRAGLRAGDRLLRIDGHELTSPEGGKALGALAPGQRVTWTYARGGRTATTLMEAAAPAPRHADLPAPPPPAGPDSPLRYSGRVGDTLVEARGGPVSVVEDPATGEIVVRSGEVWVRVRVLPPEGSDGR